VHGFSAEHAGAVLLVLFGGSVLAAFMFGQLDRVVRRRKAMILLAVCASATCLGLLCVLPSPGPVVTVALLIIIIFCQTFYIPLGAHMRKVVPLQTVGRASILLSLVGVAAIPLMQTGFGAILDLTRTAGFATSDQFRFSFGAMALLMVLCASVYAFTRDADDE
jgi:MFS family permease